MIASAMTRIPQLTLYRAVLAQPAQAGDLRTLDIGGDKSAP